MKRPVSTDELPLSELIRFAADHGLTAALELRSRMAVGRIAFRNGEVIDAVFGGLEGEAAIHAALASRSLSVFRGRPPRSSAVRKVFVSVEDLIESVIPRQSSPRASLGKLQFDPPSHRQVASVPAAVGNVHAQRIEPSRPSQVQRLGIVLFLGAAAAITGLSCSRGGQAAGESLENPKSLSSRQSAFVGNREYHTGPKSSVLLLATELPRCPVSDCSHLDALPVQVLVDESGAALGAKVENTRPEFSAIEDAAIRYVLSARYQPATLAGHAVTGWAELRVRFASEMPVRTAAGTATLPAAANQHSEYVADSSFRRAGTK